MKRSPIDRHTHTHTRAQTHTHVHTCAHAHARTLTRVIEVELALQSLGLLLRSEHAVEAVLAQDDHLLLVIIHLVLPQQLHDLRTDGGLWGEESCG